MGMKMLFSQWHRRLGKKIRVLPKEVEPTNFFSPDALPLSYRRLVGAKATKLASCEKHLAYCLDWNVDMCFLNEAMIEIWWWILIFFFVKLTSFFSSLLFFFTLYPLISPPPPSPYVPYFSPLSSVFFPSYFLSSSIFPLSFYVHFLFSLSIFSFQEIPI